MPVGHLYVFFSLPKLIHGNCILPVAQTPNLEVNLCHLFHFFLIFHIRIVRIHHFVIHQNITSIRLPWPCYQLLAWMPVRRAWLLVSLLLLLLIAPFSIQQLEGSFKKSGNVSPLFKTCQHWNSWFSLEQGKYKISLGHYMVSEWKHSKAHGCVSER